MNTEESLRTARRVASEYIENRRFVKTMESARPSILSRLGINTDGYLSFQYELPARRIPQRDRGIVEEYLDRRRKKEAVEITIAERIEEEQQGMMKAVFIDGMSNENAASEFGVSLSTVNRARKKFYEELVCELVWQGICIEDEEEAV